MKARLQAQEFQGRRFWNTDVLNNLEGMRNKNKVGAIDSLLSVMAVVALKTASPRHIRGILASFPAISLDRLLHRRAGVASEEGGSPSFSDMKNV